MTAGAAISGRAIVDRYFVLFDNRARWKKVTKWANKKDEFGKRAFCLCWPVSLHDKESDDEFLPVLAVDQRAATDERNSSRRAWLAL